MSLASDEITARYSRIEREADKFGRIIGVKRLRPSQQIKLQGMSTELDGEAVGVEGSPGVPRRMPIFIAASVCEINDSPLPFPRNRAELDGTLDMLDHEGLEAASTALGRLLAGDRDAEESGTEAAKNSPGIPSSASNSG